MRSLIVYCFIESIGSITRLAYVLLTQKSACGETDVCRRNSVIHQLETASLTLKYNLAKIG